MTQWTYLDKPFDETLIEEYQGFVYLITNTLDGRKYIGKKFFWSTNRKKVKGKIRRKIVKSESNWKDYYGSSDDLLADIEKIGSDKFKREILVLCKTKSECSYHEARLQFDNRVLESNIWYNSWIMCKVRRSHLSSLTAID